MISTEKEVKSWIVDFIGVAIPYLTGMISTIAWLFDYWKIAIPIVAIPYLTGMISTLSDSLVSKLMISIVAIPYLTGMISTV